MKNIPESLKQLSGVFSSNGYKLFLVGGFVRNFVLGITGGDMDVCSSALPEEAALFLRRAGFSVIEKAPVLGTIEVHIKSNGKKHVFEHTTFRKDFYPSGGVHRPDSVEFTKDIKKDALRRDFTVNALYLDLESGKISDPTGRGIADVEKKIIRAAEENPDITIKDDGLRIMRMARFAAELGFSVSADLLQSTIKYAGLLDDISAERKRDELKKILVADTKYKELGGSPENGLNLLRLSGALPHILPSLSEGDGVIQSEEFHKHDVLGHGIRVCAETRPLLELRLAALLHDIGKPYALRSSGNMYNHEVIGERIAEKELGQLRFENRIKSTVLPLIRNHMFDLNGRAKPKTIRKRAVKLGKRIFSLLIELRRADFVGSGMGNYDVISADNWQRELIRMEEIDVPWSISDLKISGNDIKNALDIEPSPVVGRILDAIFNECVLNPSLNNRDSLIKKAVSISRNMLR